MTRDIQPLLHPVDISTLRPTQMTVGMREVARKRAQWRKRSDKDGPDFLGRHMIPAVIGPEERHYIVDHHHLVRALRDEGVGHVLVNVLADLGALDKPAFWNVMAFRNWLHAVDADGKPHMHDALPRTVDGLADDPYRSLAGELRRVGGYAKDNTPYAEFLWADFLRRRIDRDRIEDDFGSALSRALDLAHQKEADYLPGWCGADD
jgi:hypothetical protein